MSAISYNCWEFAIEMMTVIKVDISCDKCKRKVIKAVSALQGVDSVEADAETSTLTVTGDVDPIAVIVSIRKASSGYAEVMSIGPPPPPPEPEPEAAPADDAGGDEEKREKRKQQQHAMERQVVYCVPSSCPICQDAGFHEPHWVCSVM